MTILGLDDQGLMIPWLVYFNIMNFGLSLCHSNIIWRPLPRLFFSRLVSLPHRCVDKEETAAPFPEGEKGGGDRGVGERVPHDGGEQFQKSEHTHL